MSKLLISPLVGEISGRTEGGATGRDIPVISDILIDQLQSTRFAFNSLDSRSGYLGLKADLEARGAGVSIFSELVETGGHRASIKAVAEGRADVAAIDCKTWHLAKIYEPAARELVVVGWTSMRLGLPFITARGTSDATLAALREGLAAFSPP
jgi:ABC-type phosphate/phosphonate transport system substrate-binding protein